MHQAQEKVTEEELEARATASVVRSQITVFPASYGPPELSTKLYLSMYRQVWRDGGAVVSLMERVAIREAQQEKRKNIDHGLAEATITSPAWIAAKAQTAAIMYVVGKIFNSADPGGFNPEEPLTEEQRAAIKLYAAAYTKAYQLYRHTRRKFLGLF